jgi:ATP citrate (pro-S)-lyase
MARVKLSEHDAKSLIYPVFNLDFRGLSLSAPLDKLPSRLPPAPHVLKVDQGVKKRGKLGLVKLSPKRSDLLPTIQALSKQGWSQFLLEPLVAHEDKDEHYLGLTRAREGWQLAYSPQGGIEIESHWDSVKTATLTSSRLASFLPSSLRSLLPALLERLDELHLAFVEFNPLVIQSKRVIPLDLAVEIDSAALGLASLSSYGLTPLADLFRSPAEQQIAALDDSTPASLKFKLLEPGGRIWMLLSGGGASLVLADEVADLGLGKQLANYGEYSGAPSSDDTYAYTKIILQQLLKAKSDQPKAIVIAGGVANFTDVAKTFQGVIRALKQFQAALRASKVKVFVRRGGPNEKAGLKLMRDFLQESKLLGSVHGHTVPLTKVISEVKKYL